MLTEEGKARFKHIWDSRHKVKKSRKKDKASTSQLNISNDPPITEEQNPTTTSTPMTIDSATVSDEERPIVEVGHLHETDNPFTVDAPKNVQAVYAMSGTCDVVILYLWRVKFG